MNAPRSIVRQFPHLKKCVDAKRPVAIEVKKRDVNNAVPGNEQSCAMALAICREWKADAAIIGMTNSFVIKGSTAIRFTTPESVRREIVSFDRTKDFDPGVYHLGPISPSQRRGLKRKKRSGGAKPAGSKNAAKRRTFHGETLRVRNMRDAGKIA